MTAMVVAASMRQVADATSDRPPTTGPTARATCTPIEFSATAARRSRAGTSAGTMA